MGETCNRNGGRRRTLIGCRWVDNSRMDLVEVG
jgi:hypothetical protein